MRIERITLKNYRAVRSMTINFLPISKWDLFMVIAKNGVGKTTLLNAINWCFYGDEPHLASKYKSLPVCNENVIDEAVKQGLDHADVSVEIEISDTDQKITFKNSLSYAINPDGTYFPGRPECKARISDSEGKIEFIEEMGAYRALINQYIPQEIRKYFFFDGEQLQDYFFAQTPAISAEEVIKNTVHQISQITMVTRAVTRLTAIHKDIRYEIGKTEPDMSKKLQNIADIRENISETETRISTINENIEKAENDINDRRGKLSAVEGLEGKFKIYVELEKRLKDKEKDRLNLYKDLESLAVKYAKLLYFYELNKKVKNLIDKETENGALPPDIDKKLLETALDLHLCPVCNTDIDQRMEMFIQKVLSQISVSSATSNKLSEIKATIDENLLSAKQYKHDKELLISKLAICERDIDEIQNDIGKTYLDKKAGENALNLANGFKDDIVSTEKAKALLIERLGAEKENLKKLYGNFDSAKSDYQKEQERSKENSFLIKQNDLVDKAINILRKIEQERMDEVRKGIEERTEERFKKLVWKEKSFGPVKLDDNYKLDLLTATGKSCLGSCGAAERALLALAFTLAIHDVSEYDAMLFIDTPVARISDENRYNFGILLRDVSLSKQIILTFTPDEYSDEMRKAFQLTGCVPMYFDSDESETILREG